MNSSDLVPRRLRGEAHFRWRGGEVSRVEALSDAVFALALTLLVVALEVPETSAQLAALFWQFPAFALCFGFLLWVWYEHFLFHRRFGFEDAASVALNGVLLFFVVFYVFPLKFLAAALITEPMQGVAAGISGGRAVMLLYSGGFVGIFAVLALSYWRAWRLREVIALDRAERAATRGRLRQHLLIVGIGLASIGLVFAFPRQLAWSGLVYFLLGPVSAVAGYRTGKEIEAAVKGSASSLTSAEAESAPAGSEDG